MSTARTCCSRPCLLNLALTNINGTRDQEPLARIVADHLDMSRAGLGEDELESDLTSDFSRLTSAPPRRHWYHPENDGSA